MSFALVTGTPLGSSGKKSTCKLVGGGVQVNKIVIVALWVS